MLEAGGVGIFRDIESTQLIEKAKRSKIQKLRNCAELERIWNVAFRKTTMPSLTSAKVLDEHDVRSFLRIDLRV